jgi:chloramphenicol 3-O phosphotransferase
MAAILLNGTSSAGKSSIAKAIQKAGREPFIHIELDQFVDMFCWDAIHDPDLRRECHRAGVANLHASLPALLAGRFPGVIDHVFERDSWYHECLAALGSHRVLVVGVHCSIEVVRSRELARGDRRIGLAEAQFKVVHQNREYDMEVCTDQQTPEACATLILEAFYKKLGPG